MRGRFPASGIASAQRRRLLQLALAASVPGTWRAAQAQPPAARSDPFRLGVASGPALDGGVVLWTRIVPDIDAEIAQASGLAVERYIALRSAHEAAARAQANGQPRRFEVQWELAGDEAFRTIVHRGTALAPAELGHSVHVEIAAANLAPGRWYWYRFMLGDAASPVGRTATLPAPDAAVASLRIALASCQHYEYGHFGAYARMRDDDPQAVLFVGDYIYEGGPREKRFRPHPFPSARTLYDYRLRHALYRRDPALQAMHAFCPWWLTWDDHEVSNDYAGDVGEEPQLDGAARRRAAYQAYYEHMPIPAAALVQRFGEMQLYRRIQLGTLAQVFVLDDRQYRDRQACQPNGRGGASVVDDDACPQRRDPARTLLGAAQMDWLQRGFAASSTRWNFIAQQTLFSPLVRDAPRRRFWTDGWDGYPAERARVLAAIERTRLANPVFAGGDLHANWVCDVKRDFDAPDSPVIASEFCGTSITSASSSDARRTAAIVRANSHVRFADSDARGYTIFDLAPRALEVRLRAVDDVRKPQPEVSTLARFAVADGRPGAVRI